MLGPAHSPTTTADLPHSFFFFFFPSTFFSFSFCKPSIHRPPLIDQGMAASSLPPSSADGHPCGMRGRGEKRERRWAIWRCVVRGISLVELVRA